MRPLYQVFRIMERGCKRFDQWKLVAPNQDDPDNRLASTLTYKLGAVAPAFGRGNSGILLAEGEQGARVGGAIATGGERFGPYTHGLNKGGLSNIVAEQQLVATEARGVAGGESAVRAYTSSLDKLAPYPSTDFIEFYTQHAPTPNPGQRSVSWPMDPGSRLDITVTRIAHPDGSLTIFPQNW
jgi:hypothetical protein